MRTFRFEKDYYEKNLFLYKKGTATINPGVTVLVGCNGSGKTTLLQIIKDELCKENIPVLSYNHLSDGGDNARQLAMETDDFAFLATSVVSSEGENIVLNIGKLASNIKKFFRSKGRYTGNPYKDKLLLSDIEKGEKPSEKNPAEYWILLDATDSGLSIDNVIDIKNLFSFVLNDVKDKDFDVYIVISANEYEMCADQPCFLIPQMKYVSIKTYGRYKKLILETRKYKDERLALQEEKDRAARMAHHRGRNNSKQKTDSDLLQKETI